MTDEPQPSPAHSHRSGLIQGGLGGPEGEMLEDGQEEVFSRTEIESGRIEHATEAGGSEPELADGPTPAAP